MNKHTGATNVSISLLLWTDQPKQQRRAGAIAVILGADRVQDCIELTGLTALGLDGLEIATVGSKQKREKKKDVNRCHQFGVTMYIFFI